MKLITPTITCPLENASLIRNREKHWLDRPLHMPIQSTFDNMGTSYK